MATPSPVSCAICNMLVSDSNEQRHVQTHHSTPPDLRRPSECFPSLNWIDCPAPGCVCSMRKGDPLMAHYIESHPEHANENLTTFFPSAVCCDCGHWSFNRVCAKRHRSMKHRDAITHPPKVSSRVFVLGHALRTVQLILWQACLMEQIPNKCLSILFFFFFIVPVEETVVHSLQQDVRYYKWPSLSFNKQARYGQGELHIPCGPWAHDWLG